MPGTPRRDTRCRDVRSPSTSTAPDGVERRDERDPDAAEVEVARHADERTRHTCSVPKEMTEVRVPSAVVPTWLEVALTLVLGFATGVLSGMFGLGGAVISTPANPGARRDRAASRSDRRCPSILPSSISGSLRYQRERFIRWRIVAVTVGVRRAGIGRRARASPTRCRATVIC